MIDPLTEHVISLTEAAKRCPTRRGGKHTSISCLYRWTTSGCKGEVLESIQVGGTRCTSREALARFFQQLTERVVTVRQQSECSPGISPNETEQQLDSLGM